LTVKVPFVSNTGKERGNCRCGEKKVETLPAKTKVARKSVPGLKDRDESAEDSLQKKRGRG